MANAKSIHRDFYVPVCQCPQNPAELISSTELLFDEYDSPQVIESRTIICDTCKRPYDVIPKPDDVIIGEKIDAPRYFV